MQELEKHACKISLFSKPIIEAHTEETVKKLDSELSDAMTENGFNFFVDASLVKQVANSTNDVTCDGFAYATVLTCEIGSEGCKSVAARMNAMDLRRRITMVVDSVVSNLNSRPKMIDTSKEIAILAMANGMKGATKAI
ncbi:chaperonin CPN60-2, mitochondrial [Tanacetum coccineum]